MPSRVGLGLPPVLSPSFRPPPVTAWCCPLSGGVPGGPPRASRPSRSSVPRVTHCLPPRITAMSRCAVGYGEVFSSRALVVAFVVLLHGWPSACCRAGLIGSPCIGHAGIVSPTAARRRRARRGRSSHHFFAMPFSTRLAWAPQMSANGPTACMFLYSEAAFSRLRLGVGLGAAGRGKKKDGGVEREERPYGYL